MAYSRNAFGHLYEVAEKRLQEKGGIIRPVGKDPDPGYYFAPGELIVRAFGLGEGVRRILVDEGFRPPRRRRPVEREDDPSPFEIWRAADFSDDRLVALVRQVRKIDEDAVGLNHIMFGVPSIGCAASVPEPAPPPPSPEGEVGAGIAVGVVDTGLWPPHPWFPGHVAVLPGGGEAPAGSELDLQDGHGTFVSGVVRQMAPGAMVVVAGPLTPWGTVTDAQVADAVHEMTRRHVGIVNLSLGCFTLDDQPPLAEKLLFKERKDTVIVAAAGNKGVTTPFWPAALGQDLDWVYSVGALDPATGGPADFSNHGAWVKLCAPGIDVVSSFFHVRSLLRALPSGSATYPATPLTFYGYATWSGTSFAAPQFAGAVAAVAWEHGISPRGAATRLLGQGPLVPGLGREFAPNLLIP